ncbi:hypothetical protein AB0K62_14020 [Streptomyces halstedii]|uniref:hypothetical protein n=1 Tax=Streptomyces TaxID=1883 RepID=UPI0004A90C79|nr:hypothetical protein [Streptomyces sp. NTK 937]KDQ67402.1 membrane protein [Streptomyces sp. NTK 937]
MYERRRAPGPVRVLLPALGLLVLTACHPSSGAPAGLAGQQPSPGGYGDVFLGPADCSSRGEPVREVSCRSEKAAARVLARYSGVPSNGPACPPATDFVLHIAENGGPAEAGGPPEDDRDGPAQESGRLRGYACMRNLEPPHPGDPGQGGGPLTVVGDCVYASREGEVKETACDGSGTHAPEFEVESAVASRDRCPGTTDLYVQLGGDSPVGCAHRVR